ncbi:hypothetical protein AVCANL279_07390 [Campylobacter canadensis]|uniref:hypothetical protein n=1 Tax=Campylobacter canadensis TaxID=449520 RepID=UPI00155630A3|nr:hypothetical protein [Campylobacter canadensis]MBZ7995160.1 hypothetical protein [Campylobacter canadensis]MBZ7997142.1 hypothetical protein [Campylobacter canadensis]MBZ8000525.1 hypothetical protein [Campylobacter canadensis]MBZ8003836.1 hypothetical protein [Campylobacter canadensis]
MESDILHLVSIVQSFEKFGIVGILGFLLLIREYQFFKTNKSQIVNNERQIALIDKLKEEIQVNNDTDKDIVLILQEIKINLEKNNEVNSQSLSFVKDTCVGVKVRIDKIDDKLNNLEKIIISNK